MTKRPGPTPEQERQNNADWDLIQRAADKARLEARQGQAAHAIGEGAFIPFERYVFVGLLDELALAAGRGDLSDPVRQKAVELAESILAQSD